MNLRRAALVLLLALPLTFANALPANAEEPTGAADVVAPVMSLLLLETGPGTHVCADGDVAAAGSWMVSINGVRSNATQISYGAGSAPTKSFYVCTDIDELGTTAGSFYVLFVFEGGTSPTVTVRPGSIHGVVAWRPTDGDFHFQTTGG